ncbi:ggdef domain protein [Bacillus subtilis]|uniref:Ggdef domain protein n=1 Tax=Bacillus subtilis TaxID=1423 RepID=A0A0D1IR09_BACIU|nr:ggdef domain protein [Bacillus subtilis]
MVFGFTYQHSIIDLRNIPIMIAALYGGWVSTPTALAMITAGRLLITMNTSALYYYHLYRCHSVTHCF